MAAPENDELFVETFSTCDENELELEESSPKSNGEPCCSLCESKLLGPRLLSCLHVFCFGCLEKEKKVENGQEVIVCPTCQQETLLGRKGVQGLACDYISTNIQDMLAINTMAIFCTSCKTKEEAVARCSDCANYLCPNCNTAHQFMRCFEDHKVVSFEALKNAKEAVPIHKPVFCETHPTESMKYFCYTCMVPVCGECVVVAHCAPEHHYERMSDAYERQKRDVQALMTESKAKVQICEEAQNTLQNALSELQAQHDNARGLIKESIQSYKAILDSRGEDLLDELKELHSERELKIMDLFQSVEKCMTQIEDANKFTSRLLEHGSVAEVLSLCSVVSTQLMNLINNTPKPDVNTSIEFVTDMDRFTTAVQASFGYFRKPESAAVTATTTPQQESPHPPSLSLVTSSVACPPSSVTSSPVSMPSSFEGELGLPLMPLTTIQEYNLSALASLATDQTAQASSAPSPTPSFTLNEFFPGDSSGTSYALKNLEALAKLGNVSLNDQELVNGSMNGAVGAPLLGRGSPIDGIPSVLSPINGGSFPRSSPTAILSSASSAASLLSTSTSSGQCQ